MRTMPASRAVKPGCYKNLGRGFPEVLPKTALCAGYLSQGIASFSASRQVATCCGQRTCDIRNYAARSLTTGPSLRHGPPLLAFDAAHRDRAPARRSLVPHLRAIAPFPCHCSQHLAVKTLTLRFAKASLSNRPLFECLRKKLFQIVAISSTCPAF